jgi:hypothetical protein
VKGSTEGQGTAIRALLEIRVEAAFGLPEETVAIRLTLTEDFARTADQARRKILDLVERGQEFALESRERDEAYAFRPEQVVMVATWEAEGLLP